jgi:hemerythrin-like domain-containing protein
MRNTLGRRKFIERAAAGVVGAAMIPGAGFAFAAEKRKAEDNKENVTPPEDLMREHGVLDRVLLIYDAGLRKLARNEDFDPAVITDSARIVREFIEDYHEKSEEEDVFPHFKKAGKMVDLVDTLLEQHRAGRRVTEVVLRSAPNSRKDGEDRRHMVSAIQSFIAMYRPHAAREDTVLFPMLHDVVSMREYDAMAERFEDKEHRLFGADGFEKMVDRVARIEKTIGVYDLSQFTPR